PGTASGVKLSDTLPTNTGAFSIDSDRKGGGEGKAVNVGGLTCVGESGVSLAANASLSVHISSTTGTSSWPSVTNTASASSSNDGNPTSAPATVTVDCPQIAITKTADSDHVSAGQGIGFTITVTNNGPGTASGVKLSDTLRTNTRVFSIDSQDADWGCSCAINAGVLTCGGASGVSLAANASLSVRISSPPSPSSCPSVTNTSSASSCFYDNPPSAQISVLSLHDALPISKTADSDHVSAGQGIGFTITVTNNGPGTASGVKLSDTLPTNTGAFSIDSQDAGWSSTCAINAYVLTCGGASGVSLAANASLSVHISSTTSTASR